MVGNEKYVPFGFFARPKITNRDSQMRPPPYVHDPLDKLDRHLSIAVVSELALKKGVLAAEKLETQFIVTEKLIQV